MSIHAGQSRLAFAKEIGVPDSTLGNYERDERQPDSTFLARLRERKGVDLNWLLTGIGAPALQMAMEMSGGQALVAEGSVALPKYDIRASAGAGALVVSSEVSEYFSVGRDWLQRNLPPWAPPNAVVGVLEGQGDSMEPTIRDGDLIIVCHGVERPQVAAGGIFVFSLDGDLKLKRLQLLATGDLRIISDNKAYEVETVAKDQLEFRVVIHAQVFFAGGRPRRGG